MKILKFKFINIVRLCNTLYQVIKGNRDNIVTLLSTLL